MNPARKKLVICRCVWDESIWIEDEEGRFFTFDFTPLFPEKTLDDAKRWCEERGFEYRIREKGTIT